MDHQIAAIAITLASHPFQTLLAVITVVHAIRAFVHEGAARTADRFQIIAKRIESPTRRSSGQVGPLSGADLP
jgi:hypothetical protein